MRKTLLTILTASVVLSVNSWTLYAEEPAETETSVPAEQEKQDESGIALPTETEESDNGPKTAPVLKNTAEEESEPEYTPEPLSGTWKKNSAGWWYEYSDGTYPHSTIEEIDSEQYYFNNKGYMATGWVWYEGFWYYFQNNGAMLKSAWQKDYYLTEDGSMAVSQWIGEYYVGADGKWIRGYGQPVWVKSSKGWWCKDGYGGYYSNGWYEVDGAVYHFNKDGYINTWWYQENGNWYYLGKDGAKRTSCWIDSLYYVNEDGIMETSAWVDSEKYYVGADGKWIKDYGIPHWEKNSDGWWYNSDGCGAFPADEWVWIDDKRYYFDSEGYMQTGWYLEEGTWYYLDSSGKMITGWKKIKDKWYHFQDSGEMTTGWLESDGSWYYLSSSGAMQTGWCLDEENWFYLDTNGKMITGWKKINNKWYYFHGSGEMATGWLNSDGSWYYLSSSGAMQTGWCFDGGSWYYLDSKGKMITGWKWINSKWYYFQGSGEMTTGWLKLGENWYYLSDSGAMLTGLQYIDGTRYFFNHRSGILQPFSGFSIRYYSQLDPAWSGIRYGGYTFGSTGCGIASIAMAVSTVLDTQVLPTDVADYMYYHTGEYNNPANGNSGNTGYANMLGAQHWGINCDIIYSKAQMDEALQQGKVLTIAVNPGTFTAAGTTHEMVLFGWSGGQTYVYDPLGNRHSGWHDTAVLWSQRSTDPIDLNVGTAVFSYY